MNWLIFATVNVVCAVICASLLAYGCADLQWRGKGTVLGVVALLLWGEIWLLPQTIATFGFGSPRPLYGFWFANWLVSAFGAVLLPRAFAGISRDFGDAARVDGCGSLRIFWHVILPLVKPALVAIAALTLMATCGDLIFLLSDGGDQTIAPSFFGAGSARLQFANAANGKTIAMLALVLAAMTLPAIAIFFLAQRPVAAEAAPANG